MRILFFILILLMTPAWANNTKPFSKVEPHKDSIHLFTLPNGLQLIIKEDHRAPVVFSSVWYKVGASNEPLGMTGISHALEHMMFRGTPAFRSGEFPRIIADNGGEENASTWPDFTNYYQILPADKLAISFQLEADRMQHLSLDEQAFKKEIQVVMEERRLSTEDDPQQTLFERFAAVAHTASPYHHSVIGWMNDLQHLKVEDLRQWYRSWYAPNNAIVLIVGDVKADPVYTLAKQYFGSLKSRPLPQVKPQREVEPLGKKEVLIAVPAKLPTLLLGYNVPSLVTAEDHYEAYALEVLAAILNGGESARLPKKLVRAKQIAVTTSVGYDLYSRLDGLFVLSAIPTQQTKPAELEAALLTEVKNLQTKSVSLEELNRVKIGIIARKAFQQDSIEAQAEEIGKVVSVGRSWQDAEDYSQRIDAVTALQVQAVANKYLSEQRLTVGKLQPLTMQ